MSDPVFRIERRASGIYRVLFHAGPYYWPVTDDMLARLTTHTSGSPETFLAALMETVAVTRYLKCQLETVLAGTDDRDAQLRALQAALTAR
jgi:hypothetical protein